jgi:hypothetical protein
MRAGRHAVVLPVTTGDDSMDAKALKDLLERAARAVGEYAQAIDGQLYRVSSYYGRDKEREMYALELELELATSRLKEDA